MEQLSKRKPNRLNCFDYTQIATYSLTVCTEGMRSILSTVTGRVDDFTHPVGEADPGLPSNRRNTACAAPVGEAGVGLPYNRYRSGVGLPYNRCRAGTGIPYDRYHAVYCSI